mmetsp:Transcript_42655/g.114642  ORF Transcript_42655/g.114642 Transcript_42655/m.114642 type:complete len:332 (+) Transcript_42655:391-1386(+)
MASLLDVRRGCQPSVAIPGRIRCHRGGQQPGSHVDHAAHHGRVRPVRAGGWAGHDRHLGAWIFARSGIELLCPCPWPVQQPGLHPGRPCRFHRSGLQPEGRRHVRRGVGAAARPLPDLVLATGPGAGRHPAGCPAAGRLGHAVLVLQARPELPEGAFREHAHDVRPVVLRRLGWRHVPQGLPQVRGEDDVRGARGLPPRGAPGGLLVPARAGRLPAARGGRGRRGRLWAAGERWSQLVALCYVDAHRLAEPRDVWNRRVRVQGDAPQGPAARLGECQGELHAQLADEATGPWTGKPPAGQHAASEAGNSNASWARSHSPIDGIVACAVGTS